MIYYTRMQAPRFRQMTFDMFLDDDVEDFTPCLSTGKMGTYTMVCKNPPEEWKSEVRAERLKRWLESFLRSSSCIGEENKERLYYTFYCKKKDKGIRTIVGEILKAQRKRVNFTSDTYGELAEALGKLISQHPTSEDRALRQEVFSQCINLLKNLDSEFIIDDEMLTRLFKCSFRRIDAPCTELKTELTKLKDGFECSALFGALYHTSAFAYVKGRCAVDAVARHRDNKSKWFCKFDLSDFFGSTTLDFTMDMLSIIYPFSEVIKDPYGKALLSKALSLAFLNGGLPQGTPISPLITNIIMIPIDFLLSNKLRNFNSQRYVYTRYADDFLISSKYDFDYKKVEAFVSDTLKEFNAPFSLNPSKTRYGSSAGSNWNLGVMLNKDNEITVGHKKKREFKAMLTNYVLDKRNGKPWSLNQVQVLDGCRSYYSMVEKDAIEEIIRNLSEKWKIDIKKSIKDDLRL